MPDANPMSSGGATIPAPRTRTRLELSSLRPAVASCSLHSYINNRTLKMSTSIDSQTLKQYLADSPPSVVPLAIKPHFEALSDKEKLYAHHISV